VGCHRLGDVLLGFTFLPKKQSDIPEEDESEVNDLGSGVAELPGNETAEDAPQQQEQTCWEWLWVRVFSCCLAIDFLKLLPHIQQSFVSAWCRLLPAFLRG
jgi:hypothetical protein